MTGILTILTLHTSRILQKVSTKSTSHDIVELLQDEFVPEHFMNFFFALTYGTFTVQANVERSSVCYLFYYVELVIQVPTTRTGVCY